MLPKLLTYKNSTIAWYQFGNGQTPLICFHGYAENGSSFAFLSSHLGNQYTLYAVDLPFHGATEWKEEDPFTHTDLVEVVRIITVGNPKKWTLMGFSLGGRICLSLYQSQHEHVDRMVLLAPDGLKVNFWYWLSTRTAPGNRLFAYTMKKPGWFFGLLKSLNGLRLVNRSIFKFVNNTIGDAGDRHLLYTRWTSLRKLKPNLDKIKSLIRKKQTPVRLIYGKHDRIILTVVGEKFRKGIEDYCEIIQIQSGHQVLHEKHVRTIVSTLENWPPEPV